MHTLYVIENLENGKLYIGITRCSCERRMTGHKCASKHVRDNSPLHHAIKKYGADKFLMEPMAIFDSEEEAKQEEIFWISYLKDFGCQLYNVSLGGDLRPINTISGENSANHKLTTKMVQAILAESKVCSNRELAKKYGVSEANIGQIVSRKTWKEVPFPPIDMTSVILHRLGLRLKH